MSFKVFTIKEGIPIKIYGFERTQLSRQNILKSLNIEHEMVITNILNFVPNFVETLECLGFNNFYHVILDLSDISRDEPSVKPSDIEEKENIKLIKYTKNGYVGLVEYNDGSVSCYTSKKLYHFDNKKSLFYLYDCNGNPILIGDVSQSYHSYEFVGMNKVLSQWQILIEYLSKNSSKNDKFFIDMINKYPNQLRKFFQNTNRELISVTHYNILDPGMKFVLQTWCKNVVASPVLETKLNSKVDFIPPVFIENVKEKTYSKITNWCMVGNMSYIKRCEWAIKAFEKLPNLKLTIYGDLPLEYRNKKLPDNINFVGFKKEIPYNEHEGYLSCSKSECFANAAVEASSEGLFCLLANTDLAHSYYKSICDEVEVFNDFNELLDKLNKLQLKGEYKSATFAKNYTRNKVKDIYNKFFSL